MHLNNFYSLMHVHDVNLSYTQMDAVYEVLSVTAPHWREEVLGNLLKLVGQADVDHYALAAALNAQWDNNV